MKRSEAARTPTLLLVDDDESALELYEELLSTRLELQLTKSSFPTHALSLASEELYDIIIIDVSMQYLGSQFGGLELYKQLLPRYGKSSLLAYSQYITDDLLKMYNYNFHFLEKGTDTLKFIKRLRQQISDLRSQQACFVAMPFSPHYLNLYATIEECVHSAGYRCLRMDQEIFSRPIVETMLQCIRESKIVVFVAEDQNSNAFFECGYAVALSKEVVTIVREHDELAFDIRDRHAIAYGGDLAKLREELTARLKSLTSGRA